MSYKDNLLEHYNFSSPDSTQYEEIDGTYYPRDIPEPEISFIPPAEPHVIITDLYRDPQDWYYIRELIEEFVYQSYTAYYRGLFFASFNISTSCLELILKYELIRNGKHSYSELEKSYCTLYWAIERIDQIGLNEYESRLNVVHKIRNGMFHFNPKKLNESLVSIQDMIIDPETEFFIGSVSEDGEIFKAKSKDFPWSISEYSNNKEWSKVAFFTYQLMHDISKHL